MVNRRTMLGAGTAALGLAALRGSAVLPGNTASAATSIPWSKLGQHLRGQLVLPTDPYYAIAKELELGQFDGTDPQAVAYCVSPADVSTAVRFAQDYCVPVAVRSGGHSYGGYSSTPGLIIDVFRLNAVTVGDSTVTIQPGAQNVQILNTLAPYGLVVSEGGCPTVAAGGFLQGGGFGFLTRPLGMACDALVSAQVVLADGSLVTASEQEHPDLFWAIRGGGGGNFGVVTSFTVTPHAGDQMASSTLVFPFDRAVDVLDGFARWLVDAPRTIGGGAYIAPSDGTPGSAPNLVAMLACHGTAAQLAAETQRLGTFTGAPVFQQDGVSSYRDLMMNVFGCATLTEAQCQRSGKTPQGQLSRPVFGLERSRLSGAPFTHDGWAQVMTAFNANPSAGQSRFLDLQMFGGAANDPARTDTAYVHRDSLFSVNYRAQIYDAQNATDDEISAATQWVYHGFDTINPLSNGETYQNWIDPVLPDWKQSYYAENYARLSLVKSRYDRFQFFRFAQSIQLA
ncbi:MAG TPA: FAD-dependent oxidoreductase [Pseudonocardiaceae bacterium]|nr:FAD-dependent oxidoreductase [Pseudonocardiaceae bacterium]